jgi:hypothetical protein
MRWNDPDHATVNGQEFSRVRYGQEVSGQIYACFSCLVSAEKVCSLVPF